MRAKSRLSSSVLSKRKLAPIALLCFFVAYGVWFSHMLGQQVDVEAPAVDTPAVAAAVSAEPAEAAAPTDRSGRSQAAVSGAGGHIVRTVVPLVRRLQCKPNKVSDFIVAAD
jgi:hypothetical protein